MDFFLSPAFVIALLLFYWVPFAVGAYFVDQRKPERARRSRQKLVQRPRHITHGGHAPAATGA